MSVTINGRSSDCISFFVDETFLQIENKPHVLLACLGFRSPIKAAIEVIEAKGQADLNPDYELKWGKRDVQGKARDELTKTLFEVVGSAATAFIVLVEGSDKQEAAEILVRQILDFCKKNDVGAYSITLDSGLVKRVDSLAPLCRHHEPCCLGLQSHDSSSDQIVQLTDIFAGFARYAIRQELGEPLTGTMKLDIDPDFDFDIPLGRWFIVEAQSLLWASTESGVCDDGDTWTEEDSNGLGFVMQSSVSAATRQKIRGMMYSVSYSSS